MQGQVIHSKAEEKKAVSKDGHNVPNEIPSIVEVIPTPSTDPEKTNTTNYEEVKSPHDYNFWFNIALVVFTAFIAISTCLLWWSTRKLWKSTHAAFIATNRPRLRVRGIQSDGFSKTDIEPTWVYIANIGGSDATDITFNVVYAIREGITRRAPWIEELPNSLGHGKMTLASGECQTYEPRTKFSFEVGDSDSIKAGVKILLIIGTVRYSDANQTKRETGFGWIYDPRAGEFSKPEKEDQYNYED